MSVDPLDFLDEDSAAAPNEGSDKSDALSFLDEPKKSKFPDTFEEFLKSKPPEKGRHIGADIITTGTSFAGLPGDLASLFIDNPLTSESLRKKAFELIPSLAPKNEEERKHDENLSAVMGLATPTAPFAKGAQFLGKGVSKATSFLKGKYHELPQIGRSLGISEEALAPFKHGKIGGALLKAGAKLSEKAKEAVNFAQDLASPVYKRLFEEGSKIPLNRISLNGVTRGLEEIIKDIEKSPALVEDSKGIVNFLKEAVKNLKTNPNNTVENLMALQKEMGQIPGWGSLKKAKKGHLIDEARNAVMKGIYGMSPRLGEKFSNMDKLYAGYERLAKEVSPSKLLAFASKGGPLGYFTLSVLSGKPLDKSLTNLAELYFGKKAFGYLSGKLLTDPKWVGIKEKIINMVKKGATEQLPKLMIALKRKSDSERKDDKFDFSEYEQTNQ